jgi:hypothetical protein
MLELILQISFIKEKKENNRLINLSAVTGMLSSLQLKTEKRILFSSF